MNRPRPFRQTDPWTHRERGWSEAFAAQSESLLALSNGYMGIRGTLDEGEPAELPGSYLNGCYELRPLHSPDRGYGDPELDQVLVDVTDGTRIRLAVAGEPLDVRTGTVLEHEQALDLRSGLLVRTLRWRSPAGHEVRLRSRRLVSLADRHLAAIEYEVEATERPAELAISSELIAELDPSDRTSDPRSGSPLPPDTLLGELASCEARRGLLVHRTRRSRMLVGAGMDHLLLDGAGHESIEAGGARARWSLTVRSGPGRPLRLAKLLAYHHTPEGEPAELAAALGGSLDLARRLGFEGLAARQRAHLDAVWDSADIVLEGDDEIQHALRYALFQVHTNAAFAAGHAIPAKGLTGPGYNGHTFWDTEIFLLPVLTYCAPELAAEALRWRASTLPKARERARRLGLRGAAFPWRTIGGEECSGYLPAGTAAFHINADIAHAVGRYLEAAEDERFEREAGAPLLVETARLWASLGHHDERRGGRFSIDGVTGPDEYSTLVDNNLYTNLMAQANLRAAADAVERVGADVLGVSAGEVEAWRQAADAITLPYDEELDVHCQDEDFLRHAAFDFASLSPGDYPLFLHVPYFELYRRRVIKQPDLVLAMALHPDAFSAEERRRNLVHYEALTVRDSSLSAGTQAVLAAQVGDVQLAYDYLAEAALLDHQDFARNTRDGLHLAALAGGWLAVIEGLAGTRRRDGGLAFAPRLPDALRRIAFRMSFRGRRLRVEITPKAATYRLEEGPALRIHHWESPLLLEPDAVAEAPIPAPEHPPPLRQPQGKAPRRRRPASGSTSREASAAASPIPAETASKES